MMEHKIYRIPQESMIAGVCAGIALYFNLPVLLVRILTVLAIPMGLVLPVLIIYAIMAFTLPTLSHNSEHGESLLSSADLLHQTEQELKTNEMRLRALEKYITSDTYRTRNQFNRL